MWRGRAPGAAINASDKLCAARLQQGSAAGVEGQHKANPTSLSLSAAMLLDLPAAEHSYDARREPAASLEVTVAAYLADPGQRIAALGGKMGIQAYGSAVAAALAR